MTHKKNNINSWLKACLILITLFFGLADGTSAQSSNGKDFWLMFCTNYQATGTKTLFITSPVATSGTVSGASFGSIPFTVAANAITTVVLPVGVDAHTSDVINNKGIHVVSVQDVTIYGLNQFPATTDAFLAFPTNALGKDYRVMTYANSNVINASEFGIVGSQNGTTVTITPSVTTGTRTAGIPYTITLNQGDAYQLVNTTPTGDLTGTLITSDKPVGAVGAHGAANTPSGCTAADHICAMLPPTTTWGKQFVTVPLGGRDASGDQWRFMASQNGTIVTINGTVQSPTLSAGQFLERNLTSKSVISSNNPILVGQFAKGITCSGGGTGDPAMILIPPTEQFVANYTVTSVSGFTSNFVNVVAPTSIVGSITQNGTPVSPALFSPIGSSGFSGAVVPVSSGNQTFVGSLPFGLCTYGWNTADSYGYAGGQSFSPVATVTSINISPATGNAAPNTNQCWQTTVKDQFNSPVANIRVDYTVNGVNPQTGFSFTDANGISSFCYTGNNVGNDNITAKVGTLTSAATFTWNCTAPSFANTNNYLEAFTNANNCQATVTYPLSVSGTTPTITYQFSGATNTSGSGTGSGAVFQKGITHVIVAASNSCGNITTGFDVTVTDNIAPTAICKTVSVNLDANGMATINPSDLDNGSSDNCGPVTFSVSNSGTICGTAPENGTVFLQAPPGTVIDQILFASYGTPNGSCGNFTIGGCNASNSVSRVNSVALNRNSASVPATNSFFGDPCGGTVKRLYIEAHYTGGSGGGTSFDCTKVGQNQVTLNVTDGSGNVSTCTTTVTVNDIEPPVITCPSNLNVNNTTGLCAAKVNAGIATATDNCTVSSVVGERSDNLTLNDPYPEGVTTITWTATDANGLTASCTQTVCVTDNENPVITCGADITHTSDAGACTYSFIPSAPAATDNCPGVTVTGVRSDGLDLNAPYPAGVTTITWTATDAHGHSANCDQMVTVTDNQPPTIICPADRNIDLNSNCSVPLPDYRSQLIVSDNCTASTDLLIVQSPAAGTVLNSTGSLTVTFTVTDASNNTNSCSFRLTKKDITPPTITCPQPIAVNNDPGVCGAVVNFGSGSLYASSSTGTNAGSLFSVNTTTGIATLIGNNGLGLGSNRLTSLAKDPLTGILYGVLGGSANLGGYLIKLNIATGAGTLVGLLSGSGFNGSPNSGGADASAFSSTGTLYVSGWNGGFNGGSLLRVNKANGNVLQANSTGNFTEYTGLAFSSTGVLWASRGGNNPGHIHTVDPSTGLVLSTLNLSDLSARVTDLAFSPSGTLFAAVGGNSNNLVTINTTTGAITTIGNFGPAVQNIAGLTFTGGAIPATDNCSANVTVVQTAGLPSGSTFPVGTTTNTFVATDASGNSSTCSFNVTVTDNEKPRLIGVPANTNVQCNSVPAPANVTATDNCPGVSAVTFNEIRTNGSCPNSYTLTRTWSATDVHNNTQTATQVITVVDNTAPTFTRPADITIYTNASCAYDASIAVTGDVTNEADNCSTGLQATFTDITVNGSCEGSHIIRRTWHLVDQCLNAAADQIQTITVSDNTAPTFAAPADITIYTDAHCAYDASVTVTGDVTNEADNCSTGLQATFTDAVVNGTCEGSHIITRTWHLVDHCGNAAADQVQTITVSDNTVPTFTRPLDITIYTDASCGYDASVAATGDVTNEADNCSTGLQATFRDVTVNGTCEGSHIIRRTWSLVDHCGNAAADQVQTITVSDNIAPTFARPVDITIYTNANCGYDASVAATGDVTNEADNCSTGLQATFTDFTVNDKCEGSHIITRTWHLVDHCGNAAADQVQTITVSDNTVPTFTRPLDITIYTDASCGYDASVAATGDVTNEADNCSTGLQATFRDVTVNGSCEGSHIIRRTWSLVDHCGNAAADQVQTITVSDNTVPTFTRPLDITIYTDASCGYDASVAVTGDVTNEADNCSTGLQATFTDVTVNGTCEGSHIITRTWSLVDHCGNPAADQIQTITVRDIMAPTFTRPADVTLYKDANCNVNSTPTGAAGDVTNEHDNCSTNLNATFTDAVVNNCEGTYTITRTWSLVDHCGNAAANQIQTIIVKDNTAPTFTRPADITLYKDANCNVNSTPTGAAGDVTNEHDNCSTNLNATFSDVVVNNCEGTYTITRTWSLVDHCGNSAANQIQKIVVKDNTPPTFTRPADITLYKDANCNVNSTPTGAAGDVTNEHDNCSTNLNATFSDVVVNNCEGTYTITRTWSLVDHCGNAAANQIQTIVVMDNTAPTFTRPADAVIPFTNTACSYDVSVANTGTVTNEHDNCSTNLHATFTDVVSQCGYNTVITRTWHLVDHCGNVAADQVQTITATDNNTPYIIYAKQEAKFGENNFIGGDVGVTAANGKAEFKKYDVLDPYTVRASSINTQTPSSVNHKVYSPATGGPNPTFYPFTGDTHALPDYTVSVSTAVPISANYKNLTIKKGVTCTVTGTLYGHLTIEEGAQVTFNPNGGVINVEEFTTKGDKNIVTREIFSNCTAVRISKHVDLGENNQFNVNGPRVNVYCGDDNKDGEDFHVKGKNSRVTANIYIPIGELHVDGSDDETPTVMTGWFIVEKLHSDGKYVTWNKYTCAPVAFAKNTTAVTDEPAAIVAVPVKELFDVMAYPNPTRTEFNIKITGNDLSPVTVRLTDMSGRVIGSRHVVAKGSVITFGSELKAGSYFAEITQGDNHKVIKLIKLD